MDDRLGDAHFLIIEVEQGAVLVDTADADQGEIDLELADEIGGGLAHHAAVAAHVAAGDQHIEVFLGAENARHVQIIGDDLQVTVVEQGAGDRLGGGADIDEQRSLVGDARGHGGGDTQFLVAHLVRALAVGGVLHAGIVGRAAVVAPQQAGVAELVDVAADGLRRDGEVPCQLVDAHVAALAHEFQNVLLSGRQAHEASLFAVVREACRSLAFD